MILEKSNKYQLLILAVGLLLSGGVEAFDQSKAQKKAAELNQSGSDQSMEVATENAMKAFIGLGQNQIPTAMKYGYRAYGNYQNSEGMDSAEDRAKAQESSMASLGAGVVSASSKGKFGADRTTFRRLDKKFLYQGSVAKTAEKMEKLSGLSREKFFDALATASENKISRNDPQLVKKVMGRFQKFTNMIPNPEFRSNVQRAVNVADKVANSVIGKAVQKFAFQNSMPSSDTPMVASLGPVAQESELADGSDSSPDTKQVATPAVPEMVTGVSEAEPVRQLASSSDSADADAKGALVDSLMSEANKLNEETIFQRVTTLYRKVTPELTLVKTKRDKI